MSEQRSGDTASGSRLAVLTGHTAGVNAIAFSPNGTQVATGSDDKSARLWDVGTGQSLATLPHGGWVNGWPTAQMASGC